MSKNKPDPRFADYQEVQDDKGKPIGFKLEGCNFFFKYNSSGGWKDEKGNLYNSEGVLVETQEDWGDDDVKDDLVDEMEDILLQEEGDSDDEPIQPTTSKKQHKEQKKQTKPQNSSIDQQLIQTSAKLKGVIEKVKVFIKSRRQKFEEVNVITQGTRVQKNESIQKALLVVDVQQRKELQSSLNGQAKIGFSYEHDTRYWFGYILVAPESIPKILQNMKSNTKFGILKRKTLLYFENLLVDENVSKKREQLLKKIEILDKNNQVKVKLRNVPQQSPLSFILELIEQCNVPLETVFGIKFVSPTEAVILTDVKSAGLLSKLHKLKQDQDSLEVDVESSEQKLITGNVFAVQLDERGKKSSKQSGFSPLHIISEQLLIQNSENGFLKFTQQRRQIYLSGRVLKRLLMYRGQDIVVPIGLKLT